MNRIYRLVWSESSRAFVPASELTRRRGKRSGSGKALAGALVAGAVSLSAQGANARLESGASIGAPTVLRSAVSTPVQKAPAPDTLPTSGKVTAGQATVAVAGDQMTVTETSSAAAIDWNTFSIGSAAGVTFVQPTASSVVLNRVLSANPSQIYGNLDANGIVFVINPQGVLIGKGAEVNVGGLVASTLELSDKDLLGGNWSFTGSSSKGTVSNAGAIHVAPGGFAALLGSQVDNVGSISAKLGSVALASGHQVTLDFDERGLLKVAVNQAALDALVQNNGAIVADGGRIILTAKSASDVLGTVVNNTGVLQALSIGERDGQVWLLASDEVANNGANGAAANGGRVHDAAGGVASSGRIDVSGNGAAAGQVTLAGTTVDLSGTIDAGGIQGAAGSVLVNSTQSTKLETGSLIDVSSTAGAGKAVVWSDAATQASGTIDGRGIGGAGAGGMVEVSSGRDLSFDANVKLGAPTPANAGTLILDPATLEIAAGSGPVADNVVYQSALQTQSGNIVLSATGQVTIDALTGNVLNLANASGLSITSQSSGGISFMNGIGGVPSGIITHNAPVTLLASGSGSIDNVGTITTHGGDISLSGVFVHLAGGLDATNTQGPAGNVSLSVFGGGILSSSASPIAGGSVLLDATYGYIGSASAAVPTATADLTIKTGGNAFVANSGALDSLTLTSNHLEGTPVAIGITASNLNLTGADGIGDGTMYSNAVRWTDYSASNPGNLTGPSVVSIAEDGNLLPGNINLPQTALTLTSKQGYILGGNSRPVTAGSLNLASPLGVGGTDFNGVNGETDQGNGGNTLLIQAGTVTANVLDPSGNITGIVNLTQQGDLMGSVQANRVLLQATGNIGSPGQPFVLNTGWYGRVYNAVAGGNIDLSSELLGNVFFDNLQAGGSLAVVATPGAGSEGGSAYFRQATSGGDLTLTGVQDNYMRVYNAVSTDGSIAITNDYTLRVDAATLNGAEAANRSINLTSNDGYVQFRYLSTEGYRYQVEPLAPLGSINLSAPNGWIYSSGRGLLRAGTASLSARDGISINTLVDTNTTLSLTAGAPGCDCGYISASLYGSDSLSDPFGFSPHSIDVQNATAYGGNLNLRNYRGDLLVGSVRSYYDYGGGDSDAGSINLYARGSILADSSIGGGRISAEDLNGNGGNISLQANGSLGLRGGGADGTTGAVYLSLGGNQLYLYTGGDLFANNDQSQVNNLNLNATYASSGTPYFYHFASASAAEALAGTPAVTFNAGSSAGLMTVNSAIIDDSGSGVRLTTDGNIRIESFHAGQHASLGIYGQNISLDDAVENTPALSMGDSSWLQIQARGALTVGSLASTGINRDSSVDLEAYGGNLTLGLVSAANANVNVYANNGDILGSAGNQVLANNLTLNNSYGAIGADPTVFGSIPINVGVAQNLTVTNEGGGGSINLVALNDPTSLNLTLNTPNSSSYAGANFLMAPATTGLGFSGSAANGAVTLATLGTTGTQGAVAVSITADTPSMTINSGAGNQLGIGYDLYFGNSYQSMATNLAGSAGQNVIVHLDDNVSSMNSLSGNIALTNLQIDENLYSGHSPLTVALTLTTPLNAFTLVRTGNDGDPTSFSGNTLSLSGSGQSFTSAETSGTNGSAPGVMTLNASSASALDLTVNLQTAGIIEVGTIDFGALGAVNLSSHVGSNPFGGVVSAIEGVDGSNSISAASVNLSATGNYAGQATIGTSGVAVNVNAPNVALTTSGDIYVNTGGTLSALALTVSHPYQDTNGNFNATSENYVYQIGGSTSLTATDDAANTATELSFSSATPVNFSFSTDRSIDVGTINAGAAGAVTLNANGNWTGWPYYNYTHIGIEQGTGSGITAGTVTLNATGYQGHAGTGGTVLNVDTADLNVNVNADVNIADSAALNSLSLNLNHQWDNYRDNVYAVTAPNIALTLVDQYWNGWGMVALQNLVSTNLQSFSLNTDANLSVGVYGGDFSGGQVNLSSSATANLSSGGSIAQAGWARYILPDTTGSAVADSAVAIKVGTLDLTVGNNVRFSNDGGDGNGNSISLPVEVSHLSVNAGGSAYVTNVGNLNVVSANIGGSGYLRAVETAPSTSASITGGSIATPLGAGNLTLVAHYGDIGTSEAPVITNTSSLTLESGADIYAANQQQLASLSINSDHNKGSIGDTSNGGLNTLFVTDTAQGMPLQLGVTDLGALGGGYQVTGLNAPQLNFSFETDFGISVGSISANSVALISDTASILHIPGNGTITAGSVSLQASSAGQSVGAAGESILIDSPNLTVSTGGNMYVADSANIDSLRFNIGSVTDLGTTPVYQLDNGAASNPLAFNVTADTSTNTLDVNSIVVTRTDAPVNLTVYSLGSGIGVARVSDNQVAGGEVDVWSDSSNNVFGLGPNPAGISASTVSLMARYGSIGTDGSGNAAPVIVTADNVSALSSGDMRITSAQTIANLTLQNYNSNPDVTGVWAVSTPDFALNGILNVGGPLDLASVTGSTTNLRVDSASALTLGTLALGSASLTLNTNYLAWNSINSDGSNGNTANITTTGNVTLSALTGVGNTAQVTTDIAGDVNLSTQSGGFNIDQISTRDLILSGVSANYYGGSPISITAAGNMTLLSGLSGGNGSGSPVTLTAGGDINYGGTTLYMSGGAITLAAGGSINGGDIWQATSASLTAAGTAAGSQGSISIGNIDGAYWNPAGGAITLQAKGDVNLYGQLISRDGVSITSTAGSIYGQSYGTFSVTPSITLNAFGDIGSGSSGNVGQWAINNGYQNNPGSVTVSAQAGGQINLLSYAAVVTPGLTGGGDVSLQVLGDDWHHSNTGVTFGQVSSTKGSVYLGTVQGDIAASGAGSVITAATSITLDAQQNNYYRDSSTPVNTAFNIGSSDAPLSLTAPQISLTANGNIYATVPTTGLTDLSVARTYVSRDGNYPGNQTVLMPASTVLITDVAADTVLDVADGGWAAGNVSAISAAYGTALNLSYAGNNAIQLGAIALNGGNLALQATSPSDISITSTGALIQANNFSFNLVDANGRDGTPGVATGGFGTLANPINTEITSLSGNTVGATAGVFMNQTGAITFTNLTTGGDIAVTTTRVGGPLANADISVGNVVSSGGSVSFTADGAIVAADGVNAPGIAAHGPSNDGGVTLIAAAGVKLRSANLSSDNGDINVTAAAGGIGMTSSSLYAGGNINVTATAGGIEMASSHLDSGNGSIAVHALDTGIDLAASFVQAGSGGALISLTADQGDVTFGSINTGGNVAITATTGAINGTSAAQNLTGQYNGIIAGSDITLNAATGIGTSATPVSLNTLNYNGNILTANTSVAGADIHLVTGGANPGNSAVLESSSGGAITVADYYHNFTLDNVQSAGDIGVTQQNYYSQVVLNNVTATGPGATFTFVAPYGNIASAGTSGSVTASRIVLNALGDASGGTLGQNYSPVNVNADVVIAVASGNISLNSVSTDATKMPLVASNGFAPTISITSAGDFLVGQIVAGQQGTVNIVSGANIFDDGDNTTQIHAGTVNLTAADAIGTALTPISTTATAYGDGGNVMPGTISAASTTLGSIYLNQTGDAVLQSLTAANGSVNVTVNDAAQGQSTLVYANTAGTDLAGNDVNVTITKGDLIIDVAQAGMTAGTVNLTATAGSLYGDGRADCCTNPNVSGNAVNLTAQTNIGSISDLASLSGTPIGILANTSNVTTSANGSQINLQYVGDVTLGAGSAQSVNPLGSNAQVLLAACGNLTLTGLNMTGVSLGLNAGTGGNGGSVIDGITGGASRGNPDVTAASVTFGAATNVGNANAALWVDAPTIAATASNGGVWINSVASTPVTFTAVTTGGGAVVIGSQGDLLVNSVNAGIGSATLSSATGSVIDGIEGASNADNPNVTAASVTVNAATSAGNAADALWVNAPTIAASVGNGGVWINDAATAPVSVTSVTTGGGAVVIGTQGDLLVQSVNSGRGSTTLNSATGSVLDGIAGGSNADNPNVTAGLVTVNAATNAGASADALWVNATAISATATDGGVWINDATANQVNLFSVTAGAGPVVIGAQGNLGVAFVNAGAFGATLSSAQGGVMDASEGTANAGNPNIVAASLTIDSAKSIGNARNALWVDATAISAAAPGGGVWINDTTGSTATVSVTAGAGPVVLGNQGSLSITQIDAGNSSVTLSSAHGSLLDGQEAGANADTPNVIAGWATLNAGTQIGSVNGALWVDAATISAAAANGGVRVHSVDTTPVTLASVTSTGGPVVINGQGDLDVKSVNAGSGAATLDSATGSVLDGTVGGSNAGHPNVTAGTFSVNAATIGGASDALWVNAADVSATATSGGVWINDAATAPATVTASVTGSGPVVIGSQGDLILNTNAGSVSADALNGGVRINDSATTAVAVVSVTAGAGPVIIDGQGDLDVHTVNDGSGAVTLNSATGSVLDAIDGGSSAGRPNVTAGSVTVNAAANVGGSSDALWVNAAAISGTATHGGVWINDAATTPVTAALVTAGAGPVVLGSSGDLRVGSIAAGSNAVTLSSSHGSVLDGRVGGSNASRPNVIASAVTVDSGGSSGSADHPLWVNAATITAAAPGGGVWINDAASTPVTVASVIAGAGPVVIGSKGDLDVRVIDAGSAAVTLDSITGSVLDGMPGGSSAAHPNVIAGAVTVDSATGGGAADNALWVKAGTITAATSDGGVWINDASTTPITVVSVNTGGGPIVIGSRGDMILDSLNAGRGDVTLTSLSGAILDGMAGGSNPDSPNVTGGKVTLDALTTVGSIYNRVYVNAVSIESTTPTAGQFINTPPTPYPMLPLVEGVSPVTEYAAYAQAQVQTPQQLPITLIGQPVRMAPPIEVTADLLGIALPTGVASGATEQDATMGTESKPIFGGNEDEIGRKKSLLKLKKKTLKQSRRNGVAPTKWEG